MSEKEKNESVEASQKEGKTEFTETQNQAEENVTEVAEESARSQEEAVQENANQEALESLQKKYDELNSRYLRLHADLENFKRRSRQDQAAAVKYRAQDLLTQLLPVIDNFERALQVEATEKEAIAIKQGVDMVYRQFQTALQGEGLETIEAVGKVFDPFVHQAIMQVKEEGFESGVVVEELQKGYQYKDRVLRPSMVKVNE